MSWEECSIAALLITGGSAAAWQNGTRTSATRWLIHSHERVGVTTSQLSIVPIRLCAANLVEKISLRVLCNSTWNDANCVWRTHRAKLQIIARLLTQYYPNIQATLPTRSAGVMPTSSPPRRSQPAELSFGFRVASKGLPLAVNLRKLRQSRPPRTLGVGRSLRVATFCRLAWWLPVVGWRNDSDI